jgi:hypothetical protein
MKRLVDSIAFICNPVFTYEGEGWSPHDKFLAGTEESVREWATKIRKRGYDVTVYFNGEPTTYMDVNYKKYSDYVAHDKEINVKYADFEHANDKNVWYLTNETDIADKQELVERFDGLIFPSKWALDNLGYIGKARVVPHGFNRDELYPEPKTKYQCLYASSPDRGFDELVRLWPEVVEREPEATLIVTYGIEPDTIDKRDMPNTMFLGKVDDQLMNQLFRTSDFWLHPCIGGELFCMSAVKAQVAQAIPVVYPTMALAETVRYGIRCDKYNFVDRLVESMHDYKHQKILRYKLQVEPFADWDESTERLLLSIEAWR